MMQLITSSNIESSKNCFKYFYIQVYKYKGILTDEKILGILIACKIMYYYIVSYAWITVQKGMQLTRTI
jgi:hypothetical protein